MYADDDFASKGGSTDKCMPNSVILPSGLHP